MTTKVLRDVCVSAIILAMAGTATAGQEAPPQSAPPGAQAGGGGLGPQGGRPGNPAEVGRLFDAYALVQAQEQLGLSDDEFSRFLPRFRVLTDARRRQMQGRMRLMNQLARLTRAATPDEAALREHLRQIDELDTTTASAVRKASEALTTTMTPLQHARFRLFEEHMERRKLDLMTRARQGNRRNQRVP